MGDALLRKKPLLGAKFLDRPKTARERAARRWFGRENVPVSTMVASGQLFKAEYVYNDEGQRTRKTMYENDGVTVQSITIYHYDQQGYLITETTDTGALIKDYIWTEGMHPVVQIDNTTGTEQVLYLYNDHLMTNRLATDQFQNVVWRWEGEAFGNTPANEIGGFSINLRFPGQYFDSETNLHYNWYRYYDPQLGRYITSDPIGLTAGMNTYSYVNQNPIVGYDPDGEFAFLVPVVVGVIAFSTGYAIGDGAVGLVDNALEAKHNKKLGDQAMSNLLNNRDVHNSANQLDNYKRDSYQNLSEALQNADGLGGGLGRSEKIKDLDKFCP